MIINEFKLNKDLRIVIKSVVQIKENTETWRIIISFVSDYPEKDKLIKEYYVWITGEYLEDKANFSADINSAQQFALNLAKKRFKESGNQIPIENGISCSNEEGISIVDPKNFIHPKEKP